MISECNDTLKELLSDLEKSEFQMQFNGETDSNICYLEIHAGAEVLKVKIGHKCYKECICTGQKEKNFNSK